MEIREINEALTMFLEDVAFMDDNIILTNAYDFCNTFY